MTPTFPLINVNNDYVDLIPDSSSLKKSSVLGVLQSKKMKPESFDALGERWSYTLVSDRVREGFLVRFLANTIYNPMVDVKPIWVRVGSYTIDELKDILCKCVDKDDDILTQFVEPNTLKKAIKHSSSYEQVYETIFKFAFEVNEGK